MRVGADISEFQTKMGMVKGEVGGMGALDKVASVGIIGLAAVIAGVGVVSLKMAGDFQEATTQLVTGAGESNSALESVRQGILKMAPEVGQMPIDLAKGLFMIESAGYHGAEGLQVLRVSAEGASVGGADMATTANAVTTVMKDYGISAANAGDATNFLVSVVSQGKVHMEDLSGSLSQILPFASALHVPLEDVGGAMATLTSRGVNASQAATYLRFTMANLANETPKGAEALKSIGLTADQVGNSLTSGGLLPTLQLIQDHLSKKFPEGGHAAFAALADMSGGVRGLGAVLGLSGTSLDTFIKSTANISGAIKNGAGEVIGWEDASANLNIQIKQLHALMDATFITIGTKMIPAVSKLAREEMPTLIAAAGWLSDHLGTVVPILGSVIGLFVAWKVALAAHAVAMGLWKIGGEAVTVATHLWTAAQWLFNAAVTANPIGLLIIAIAALVVIGVLLVTHWTQVSAFFAALWPPIVGFFQTAWNNITGFLSGVWTGISNTVSNIWNGITEFFKRWGPFILVVLTLGLALIVMVILQHWQEISAFTSSIWNNITGFLGGIWNNIAGVAGNVWNGIANFAAVSWNAIRANIVNPVAGVVGALAGVWNGVTSGIQGAFNGILGWVGGIIGQIVNAIVSPFSNMHIPMPHFSFTSAKTDIAGVKFDVPQVAVNWYAKGGIFDSPTVLGGGVGVGDAGPEAAAPISELQKYLPDNSPKIVAALEALPAKLAAVIAQSRTGGGNLDKNALLRAFGSIMADYDYANQRGLMRPA